MYRVLDKQQLNEQVTKLVLDAPHIARKAQPGQFVILRLDEYGERIPLTVADFDASAGTLTVILQAVGRTTILLSKLAPGDTVLDVVGPLGRPTEFGNPKHAVIIGGGVGCAIAYPQAKALHQAGTAVDIIAGFRSRDIVILEEEMRAVSDRLYLTTDDGSYGEKGFVTDVLRRLLEADAAYDLAIAIGPIPMMKFVSQTTKAFDVKTIVSLNPIMIDGTGMCGGCRVIVGGETKFACVDGPDFDGHLVDYDALMRRNGIYRQQEAHDRTHICRLGGGGNA